MTRPAGAPGTAGHGYRDVVHVSDEDCTEARRPTPLEARVIGLLELNPRGRTWVRLSLAQWRVVDAVAAELIPASRQAGDER